MISLNTRAIRRQAAAAFLRVYHAGEPVHLVGGHPWSGARGVVLGEEYVPMFERMMYRVLLDPAHAKYPGHVCHAEERHLLPVSEP